MTDSTFDGFHDRYDSFDQAIINMAFNRLDDVEAKEMLSGEALENTYAAAKALVTTLLVSISDVQVRRILGEEVDGHWLRRTKFLKGKLEVLLIRLEREVKAQRRAQFSQARPEATLASDLRRIRRAIHVHREATLADDVEPSDADLKLWAIVEPQ